MSDAEDTNPEGFQPPPGSFAEVDRRTFAELVAEAVAEKQEPRLAVIEREQSAIRMLCSDLADGVNEHTADELIRYSRLQRAVAGVAVARTSLPIVALIVSVLTLGLLVARSSPAEASQVCPDNAAQGGGR